MKLSGTEFQIKVWKTIQKIPRGEVKTYKQIAIEIGNPKAYRAVASACKKNPYPITIPCHRVIPSSGKIGNYFGIRDSKEKIKLLKKEGFKI
jgi:methylated-DNA-[protein]-cysteine S-methyltransferase